MSQCVIYHRSRQDVVRAKKGHARRYPSVSLMLLLSCDVRAIEGARPRYFRQFQHWSNCHRINLNIKITAQNYRRTPPKHRKDKKEPGWTKLERIEVDCIWINLKNVGPRYIRLYIIKLSLPQLENHRQLLCGHDFASERLLVCQFDA